MLSCVRNGNYVEYNKLSSSLYVYSREDDKQKLLAVCSYTGKEVPFKAPKGFDLTSGQMILKKRAAERLLRHALWIYVGITEFSK